MSTAIDHDILQEFGLDDPHVDLKYLQAAISHAESRVRGLKWRLAKSKWRTASRLQVKRWIAKHGLMPSFVSALFGIAAALPITGLLWTADILPTDSFWLALVSPPFLTAFIVGGLTWLWLRYSPEEAQAPLQCAENQLSQLDSQRTEWARLLTNAEGALAKLQSKRIATQNAIEKQKLRNLRAPERRRLLEVLNCDQLTGTEFELLLKTAYELDGYRVQLTSATGDQGADLLVEKNGIKLCIQAKRYSANVGNKAVQEAHAAKGYYKSDRCVVITTSAFTKSAIELAGRLGCELIDGTKLRSMISAGIPELSNLETSTTAVAPDVSPWEQINNPPPIIENAADYSYDLLEHLAQPDELEYPEPDIPDQPPTRSSHSVHPSHPSGPANPASIEVEEISEDSPDEARLKIEAFAEKESPNDVESQLYIVEEETEAYHCLIGFDHAHIPQGVYYLIRRMAREEWPETYEMQLHITKEEVQSYERLATFYPDDVPAEIMQKIREMAEGQWADDFSMQLHVLKRQVAAYRKINRMAANGIPADVFQKIKAKAREEWPSDFDMQCYTIEAQTKAYKKLNRQ